MAEDTSRGETVDEQCLAGGRVIILFQECMSGPAANDIAAAAFDILLAEWVESAPLEEDTP